MGPRVAPIIERMRILIITESYPPDVGGVAASASRLSRSLAGQLGSEEHSRAHVAYVSRGMEPGAVETALDNGVTVHRVGYMDRPDAQLQMYGNVLTRLHEQVGFDVLHGFYLTHAGYLAAFYARLFGVGSCVSVRGNDVDRDMFLANRLPLIRYTLEHAGAITCVSRELVQKVAALSGRSDAQFVANGTEADVFRPVEPRPTWREELGVGSGPVVGFVGELRFKKGLSFMLDAFARVRTDAQLLLVGPIRRGEKDYLHDFLETHASLKERVHAVGAVDDREELARLYCAMDVVLCPSLWDGMPNSVLEAMACGRVVLASDAGGIRDAVRSGDTGYLVSRHELGRLGEALAEVLALPAREREALGARARQHVLDAHAPGRELEAYLRIYQSLLSQPPGCCAASER